MKKIKIILILSIVAMFMVACNGTIENGAKIIEGDSRDTIQLPPAPKGYVIQSMDCNIDLFVSYKDTTTSSILKVRYFNHIFGTGDPDASAYIIKFN